MARSKTETKIRTDFKPDDRLRKKELLAGPVPFSNSTLWRMINAGKFPKPDYIGPRIPTWRWGDVQAWFDERRSSTS